MGCNGFVIFHGNYSSPLLFFFSFVASIYFFQIFRNYYTGNNMDCNGDIPLLGVRISSFPFFSSNSLLLRGDE